VRFDGKQFAKLTELFNVGELFPSYRKRTMTALIEVALKELHEKYVASKAAAAPDKKAAAKKLAARRKLCSRCLAPYSKKAAKCPSCGFANM